MRIAVSGTHSTGKTTLIGDFVNQYPHYETVHEPYWELVQLGTVFAAQPSIEDFELQLEHGIAGSLRNGSMDVLFDRCPLDLIAYLEVLSEQEGQEWLPSGKMLQNIETVLSALDLIVFLPITGPDLPGRIAEYRGLRRAVDDRLKEFLHEDSLGLLGNFPKIAELEGSRIERVKQLSHCCSDEPNRSCVNG